MSHFKDKMHQFDFCLGSAPDPAGGAYSAPPDLLAVFEGTTSKGERKWEGEGKGRKGKRKGKVGEGKGGEGSPPIGESGSASAPKMWLGMPQCICLPKIVSFGLP